MDNFPEVRRYQAMGHSPETNEADGWQSVGLCKTLPLRRFFSFAIIAEMTVAVCVGVRNLRQS